jgi:hypothetical protein
VEGWWLMGGSTTRLARFLLALDGLKQTGAGRIEMENSKVMFEQGI